MLTFAFFADCFSLNMSKLTKDVEFLHDGRTSLGVRILNMKRFKY